MLAWKDIDVLIDVGANSGQYGAAVRDAGYGGRIVSFEPLSGPFEALRARAGSRTARTDMNVSRDLEASSLLAMEDQHLRHCPDSV